MTQPPLKVFAGRSKSVSRKAEARQNALRLGLELPAAVLIEGVQRFVMFRRILRRRLHDALRLGDLRRDRAGQFQHSLFSGGRMFLRKKSDRGRFFDRDFAFVRRRFAENEREERRLPRAVRSDQAHTIAAVYLQRRVFKKRAAGEGLRDL